MSTDNGNSRAFSRALLVGTVTLLGALQTTARGTAVVQRGGADEGARLLAGSIDIHVHTLPDDRPRSIDGVEDAKLSHSRGMRAIVLKNHYESTAGLAYLVRKLVPGVEVFCGIDLNLTVGGINPAAVEHLTRDDEDSHPSAPVDHANRHVPGPPAATP